MERERNLIMATIGYEECVVESKPTLNERAADFIVDHPVIVSVGSVVVGLLVTLPVLALYADFEGRAAGRAAAKTLLKAGKL